MFHYRNLVTINGTVPLPLFCHAQKNSSRVKNSEAGMLKKITSIRAASEICAVAGYLINVHCVTVHFTQYTVYSIL
jgi:hypothetical protein